MEEIVHFRSRDNHKLVGILHRPEGQTLRRKTNIIFLNSGLEDKVGPHRIYVKIARKLCQEGYNVLRFDTHGIGDSEGNLNKGHHVENYALIEKGLFVKDALSAVDFLLEGRESEKVVMIGLCGGAVTAMLAACNDRRIDGIIAIDPAVYLDDVKNTDKVNPLRAKLVIAGGTKKAFRLESWLKIFTLRMNIFNLLQMLYVYFTSQIAAEKSKDGEKELGRPLNRLFVEAFVTYVETKRKVLFILGEQGIVADEFRYKFADSYMKENYRSFCELMSIENANHEFHSLESQGVLKTRILVWLDNNYSVGAGAGKVIHSQEGRLWA